MRLLISIIITLPPSAARLAQIMVPTWADRAALSSVSREHLDSSHQRRRCSCPPSPRGRCALPSGSAGHAAETANLEL